MEWCREYLKEERSLNCASFSSHFLHTNTFSFLIITASKLFWKKYFWGRDESQMKKETVTFERTLSGKQYKATSDGYQIIGVGLTLTIISPTPAKKS